MEGLLKWFTGPDAKAAAIRSVTTVLSTVIAVFGLLKWDPSLLQSIQTQIPGIIAAVFAVVAAGTELYRIIFKTNTEKGAEAAKTVDKALAAGIISNGTPIEIKTPTGVDDIPIPAPK